MRFNRDISATIPSAAVWILLFAALWGLSLGCARQPNAAPSTPVAISAVETEDEPLKPLPPKFEVTDRVEIKTNMGSMVVGLYGKAAPVTVENFLQYVDSGFYSGKTFHRIIPGFMIQGGNFDADLKKGAGNDPIKLEIIPGLKHEPGVIAMARLPSDVHSATNQFYICVANAPQLNGSYAAFGQVEKGEEVMYAISGVPTHSIDAEGEKMDDVPIQPVVIESVGRL